MCTQNRMLYFLGPCSQSAESKGELYEWKLLAAFQEALPDAGEGGGMSPEPQQGLPLPSVAPPAPPLLPLTSPLTSSCSGGVSRIRATSRATFPCPRITAVSQLRSGASWRGEVWIGCP